MNRGSLQRILNALDAHRTMLKGEFLVRFPGEQERIFHLDDGEEAAMVRAIEGRIGRVRVLAKGEIARANLCEFLLNRAIRINPNKKEEESMGTNETETTQEVGMGRLREVCDRFEELSKSVGNWSAAEQHEVLDLSLGLTQAMLSGLEASEEGGDTPQAG
jgi:hypothetical protein